MKEYNSRILVSRPIVPLDEILDFCRVPKKRSCFIGCSLSMTTWSFCASPQGMKLTRPCAGCWIVRKIEMEASHIFADALIPRQFFIIDEAQNLTPHEVKTIISRAGEGTKVVLTGDPSQIDNPYLDKDSNGLTYTVGRFSEYPIFGHMCLEKT